MSTVIIITIIIISSSSSTTNNTNLFELGYVPIIRLDSLTKQKNAIRIFQEMFAITLLNIL
jgi:hypothetical protein